MCLVNLGNKLLYHLIIVFLILSLPLILFIMMYGVPLPLLLRVGHVILLFLWMIFPDILGFISSKIILNFINYIMTLPK